MKFLVLKTKQRPFKPQFRVFLEDGTELTDVIRIAVSGAPELRTVSRHSIEEPGDPSHFEIRRIELEFLGGEIEMVKRRPKRVKP